MGRAKCVVVAVIFSFWFSAPVLSFRLTPAFFFSSSVCCFCLSSTSTHTYTHALSHTHRVISSCALVWPAHPFCTLCFSPVQHSLAFTFAQAGHSRLTALIAEWRSLAGNNRCYELTGYSPTHTQKREKRLMMWLLSYVQHNVQIKMKERWRSYLSGRVSMLHKNCMDCQCLSPGAPLGRSTGLNLVLWITSHSSRQHLSCNDVGKSKMDCQFGVLLARICGMEATARAPLCTFKCWTCCLHDLLWCFNCR